MTLRTRSTAQLLVAAHPARPITSSASRSPATGPAALGRAQLHVRHCPVLWRGRGIRRIPHAGGGRTGRPAGESRAALGHTADHYTSAFTPDVLQKLDPETTREMGFEVNVDGAKVDDSGRVLLPIWPLRATRR